MDNSKRHNFLQMSLSILLFSALEINTCYANDSLKTNDPAKIVNVFRADLMCLDSSVYEQIDTDVFRFITYAQEKCGMPTFTLFDDKESSSYENLDIDRESKPKDLDRIKWIVTNTIDNNAYATHPKSYTLTFDENSNDPECATKYENIANLEINPYVFPKGDGVKKLAIKNIYPHDIELTYKNDDQVIQKYVVIRNSLEPINIPAGETYTLELQPGICPPGSAKEPRAILKFSYKVKVDDNFYEKTLPISVGVYCHRELERALSALKALELKQAAAIEAAVNDMQKACEAACRKIRIEDREKCDAKKQEMQPKEEL